MVAENNTNLLSPRLDFQPFCEYPEWLWNTLQPKQPLDEEFADPDNKAYWKRLRKMKIRQANEARKKKK